MRKFTPVPIVLMVIVSIVLASGVLFPDTGSLPRLPSGPGTIGGILSSFFGSDGSAHNTDTLSGVSASGYLQNKDCSTEPVNNVWKGVDANGQGICGNAVGLLAIARFSELHGTVNVWRDGTPGYVPAVLGQDLYEGDLIESDGTGTGTIEFVEDSSLIRFWTDTDLELRYGDLSGLTVAEVILNDGRLWGRILSSTGVNLGGGGMVTGVRGTSVDISKNTLTSVYTMTITDSVNTANVLRSENAVSGINLKDPMGNTLSNVSFGGGTRFIYTLGSNIVKKFSVDKNTFYADPGFVKNTLLDITYMSDLLGRSGISTTLSGKLNAELDATIESNNTGTLYALLVGSAIGQYALSGAMLLNQENQIDDGESNLNILNKRKAKRLECKRQAKTYFPGLGSCEGSWNTLAIADMSSGTGVIYGKKRGWNYAITGDSNFDNNIPGNITNIGNYAEYIGDLGGIKHKKISLELNSPIGCSSGSTKCYIFDGGGSMMGIYKQNNIYFCKWKAPPYYCVMGSDVTVSPEYKTITVQLPGFTLTQFVIGSYKNGSTVNGRINTLINKISIF